MFIRNLYLRKWASFFLNNFSTKIFLGVLFICFHHSLAYAKADGGLEKSAYETYLNCYNQHVANSGKYLNAEGLYMVLFNCESFAISVLEKSSSPSASRYLAYLTLLSTDGAVAGIIDTALKKRGLAAKPYLLEAKKIAGNEICITPGAKLLEKPAPGFCSDKVDAIRFIDEHLHWLSKKGLMKSQK